MKKITLLFCYLLLVSTNIFSQYCSSKGLNQDEEYIQRVTIGSIDNSSGSGNGYSNFTNLSTDLVNGQQISITVTPKNIGERNAKGYAVWIDFNGDNDFNDPNEKVVNVNATEALSISRNFSIPNNTISGLTRMRVSMKFGSTPSSCETFNWGEVEDYSINLILKDSDNDGIPDNQDNCPNQAGPSSNNGCPVGNPDFVIVSISIDAGGLTTNTNDDNSLTLRENQDHKFCVNIKNTGAVTGTINNTALILTNNSDLSKASIVSNLPYPKSSLTISPNQTGKMCSETHITDTYLGNNLTNFYYLHAIADYDNNTSESNENNNQAYTSVNSYSSKTPTQLTIHDVNGNKVKETTINNKTEETDVIKSLSEGFYFIDKDGKKSKIYKKN